MKLLYSAVVSVESGLWSVPTNGRLCDCVDEVEGLSGEKIHS